MQLTKKTVLGSVQVQAPIFGGYILTGNTVILCSKSIEVCDEIYEKSLVSKQNHDSDEILAIR